MNVISQKITDAFRLAHRAGEDESYSPEARVMFRQIARKIWEAHGAIPQAAAKAAAHDPACPACNGSWPWCEPCGSYHSPCNPTCVAVRQ